MINRYTRTELGYAGQVSTQSQPWTTFVRDTVNGFRTTAHHTLMISGIAAICALALMFIKPDLVDHVKAYSPFSSEITQETVAAAPASANLMDVPSKPFATAADNRAEIAAAELKAIETASNLVTHEDYPAVGSPRQQQWVTAWLAKRYRVAGDATNMLVSASYRTAQEFKLDPLLILAVMAIESGFNPFAESPVGAQGLMQVMSKIHHEKFHKLGGVKAALNPVANIRVGSLILKEYVRRGGSVEAGLKMYVGAAAFETDSGYGSKVLAEYQRLKQVATGVKVPVYTTARAPQKRPERVIEQKEASALNDVETALNDQPV